MGLSPTGTFCWADLLPVDQARAIGFYRDLLGWSAEAGGEEFGGYAMAHLGEQTPESTVAGINAPMGGGGPPAWTIYLATDDLDATLEAVAANGGSLAFGPHDIPGMGRTAYCLDPTGAGFGLWQGAPFSGFGRFGEPGAFCWTEVYSTDAAVTRDFFVAILGLEARALSESPQFTYYQMAIPTNPEGRQMQFGVMQMTPGRFPDGAPSVFRTYIAVADADASTAKAAELGCKITQEPMNSPFGRMSTIVDAEGVEVNLIDLTKATGGM